MSIGDKYIEPDVLHGEAEIKQYSKIVFENINAF